MRCRNYTADSVMLAGGKKETKKEKRKSLLVIEENVKFTMVSLVYF